MERALFLDFIKGLAIISVVLYHIGFLNYGFLGVDVFFVVGGYLISKSIIYSLKNNKFSYSSFILKRIVRLWPLALIITAIAFILGYFFMLPQDFKLLSEQVVGSSTFTNNFVQFVTSRDYWDTSNEFKPLMHFWYIGLLFQFYMLFPLLFLISKRMYRNSWQHVSTIILGILCLCSLLTYILVDDIAINFYLLPSRFYELGVGGIIVLTSQKNTKNYCLWIVISLLLVLCLFIVVNNGIDVEKVRIIFVVFTVSCLLALFDNFSRYINKYSFKYISFLGLASYSIYLTHQLFVAYYRYTVNYYFSIKSYIILFIISLFIGIIIYFVIEKPLDVYLKKQPKKVFYICIPTSFVLIILGCFVYLKHGVVRDVPEMDIYMNDPTSWEPQVYNARITNMYDKEFINNNNKKNIFVWGDSYGRDWVNILLESHLDSVYNISYHQAIDSITSKRIHKADYVFIASNSGMDNYYQLLPFLIGKKVWYVGHKRFGYSCGPVYNHWNRKDYYDQTVIEPEITKQRNAELNKYFGDNYIDLMSLIRINNRILVFTPEKKFFSNDGMHLTKSGAIYFAKQIDVGKIIQNAE